MSKKLKEVSQKLVIGGLYRTTTALIVYEDEFSDDTYTMIGEPLPVGSLLLYVDNDIPKLFTWLKPNNTQVKVMLFQIPIMEIVSLPQEHPSTDSSKSP